VFQFQAVDNIASAEVHRELFPRLAEEGLDYRFFWEVKSNLKREQVREMKRAGVDWMQPGIESLSTHVLALMRKGVRAIDNVNLLRWTAYYGIDTSWNILWGFPHETEADYAVQAELIRHLVHLQPPAVAGRLWLERFSPLYADRETYPAQVRPEASYRYVYPEGVDLARAAYFFDFAFEDTPPHEAYRELVARVAAWKAAWRASMRPALRFRASPGLVEVEDARDPEKPLVYHLEEPLAGLYRACTERPRSARSLRAELGLDASAEEVAETLDLFCAKGLVMRDDDLFLALALPATPNR
jgi:ribosomal peptide maturation radical SAM protein 1